jgi:hypothetical protein
VHLADPRLGDAEHLADLGQGQPLVVVQGDDDLLALAEPVDRARPVRRLLLDPARDPLASPRRGATP